MKLEQPPLPVGMTPVQTRAGSAYRSYTPLVLVCAAVLWLLAWYSETAQSMIALWQRSDTFAHGYLIAPISIWLMWTRRHVLSARDMRAEFIALPLLALAGFAWLLGELAGAVIVQQFALVSMIPLTVLVIVGRHVAWTIAFPLFFLFFAVPFGDFLLPPLMQHTADFTVAALKLSGIPVYRDGLFFTLPSGSWSVVEACSGLRYLIASVTVGVLYAYLMYRSLSRRLLFVAAAIAVPILANWLRAYMIVMIGHLSSMQHAVGVDHLIYGWLFFGVVMMILFWVGAFWREDLEEPAGSMPNTSRAPPTRPARATMIAATVAAAALTGIWPGVAAHLERTSLSSPVRVEPPIATAGWQPGAETLTSWRPHFVNPSAEINQVYSADASSVGFFIRYYRNQRPGAELITSVNTLVPTTDQIWGNVGETRRTVEVNGEKFSVVESELRGPPMRLLVWSWYRVDGRSTTSPHWVKLMQAKSKLFGRGDAGAIVIVYTQLDGSRETTTGKLHSFVAAMLPGINRSLDFAQ